MRRWLRRQAANYIGITRYLLAAEHARAERDEANARAIAATQECRPYRCQVCPRQPVTTERFWHISTVNPRRKGTRGGPHRHPKLLLRHVSPEDMDALKARLFGEAS